MGLLPESPRARRRLGKVAALGAFVALGIGIAVAIPSKGPAPDTPTVNEGPAQLAAQTNVRLTRADRRAINRALDTFLPAAMERKDMRLGWVLAGPEFRSPPSSLAGWLKGTTPVPLYLPVEKTFDTAWQQVDSGPGYVIFNLGLHPRKGFDQPPIVFSGEVVKEHGAWKVNRLYPISLEYKITAKTHEIGPADFAASSGSQSTPPTKATHSLALLPLIGIFVLILLIPISLGGVALYRARRWKKAVRARGEAALPPLPSSYREGRAKSSEALSQP